MWRIGQSLRRNYPDQVLRVEGFKPSSQPCGSPLQTVYSIVIGGQSPIKTPIESNLAGFTHFFEDAVQQLKKHGLY